MKYYEDLNLICKRLNIKNIITNDIDAWTYHKKHRKIYNKLWLVETQEIDCGPIGTYPTSYPIIIKPIINLYGMSRGFKKINNKKEYFENQIDGSFWMPYLNGKNFTIDIVLEKGKIINYFCLESKPSINGTFEYHVYRPNYKLSTKIKNLIENNFIGYSGPMNIEIINEVIIEAHLRFNGDLYLYDDNFFLNLSNMIDNKKYNLKVSKKKIYLIPYFVNSNFNLNILNKSEIEDILIENNIDNIRWDNINSLYQRNDLNRLLMFKTTKLSTAKNIKNLIKKNLYLRNKMYSFVYGK